MERILPRRRCPSRTPDRGPHLHGVRGGHPVLACRHSRKRSGTGHADRVTGNRRTGGQDIQRYGDRRGTRCPGIAGTVPVTLTLSTPDTTAPTVAVSTPAGGRGCHGLGECRGRCLRQRRVAGSSSGSTALSSGPRTRNHHSPSPGTRPPRERKPFADRRRARCRRQLDDVGGRFGDRAEAVRRRRRPTSSGTSRSRRRPIRTPAGNAEAFREVAASSGTLTKLTVYVDPLSGATQLTAGIYSDSGGHSRTLLDKGR